MALSDLLSQVIAILYFRLHNIWSGPVDGGEAFSSADENFLAVRLSGNRL